VAAPVAKETVANTKSLLEVPAAKALSPVPAASPTYRAKSPNSHGNGNLTTSRQATGLSMVSMATTMTAVDSPSARDM